MEYNYAAKILRVIDGDTVVALLTKTITTELDFGFKFKEKIIHERTFEVTLRLYGINTPEVHGVKLEEKQRGLAATERLKQLLALGDVSLESVKGTDLETDKYGRYLAKLKVTLPDGKVVDVNQTLIDLGYAVPYFGGKR